jgi:hypothetical protein
MANTSALLTIEGVVGRWMLANKRGTEDYVTYLENALNCVRDFNLYNGNEVTTEKVTVNANHYIAMPSSMIGFNDLCVDWQGEWYSFTERRAIVNTTTFTGLVEGRDDEQGEGVDISQLQSYGYGAHGAVNEFNYTLDWKARRIYVDGISSDTAVLFYTSSGVTADGTTYVSDLLTPVIGAYLMWRETYWMTEFTRERQLRERDYTNEVLKARNFINSLTFSQLRDLLLGASTQAVKR